MKWGGRCEGKAISVGGLYIVTAAVEGCSTHHCAAVKAGCRNLGADTAWLLRTAGRNALAKDLIFTTDRRKTEQKAEGKQQVMSKGGQQGPLITGSGLGRVKISPFPM